MSRNGPQLELLKSAAGGLVTIARSNDARPSRAVHDPSGECAFDRARTGQVLSSGVPPKLIIFNGFLVGAGAQHCQGQIRQRDRFATTMTIPTRNGDFGVTRAGSEWPARRAHSTACELEDAAAALEERGIVGLTLDFRERSAKGFSREAARDVVQLTRSLRQSRGDFAWGVSLNAMCDAVAKTVMEMFRTRSADEANAEDLARLKRTVEAQFAEAVVTRRHLVPCTILPGSARSIELGPVRFFHQSALDPNDYGLAAIKGGAKAYFGPLSRMMARHEASWLAEVSVGGCEGQRSTEIAGLAVDVALGGLQLVVPVAFGRDIARITARTLPAYRGSFAVMETEVEAGFKRRQPGLGLSSDDFDGFIAAASAEIEAMGRFIEAYLSRRGNLPRLRRAWCNAVYWFHEGMSEPLDTVATVKLETAIENLFLAESTAKAKKRMLEGLEGMLGISGSDTVSPLSEVTFRKLVNDIAKTRSSVLHGTSPTLPGRDLGVDRSLVEGMARQFLIRYPRLVEAYERESDAAKDDIEALLKWTKTLVGGG